LAARAGGETLRQLGGNARMLVPPPASAQDQERT
jgi:hypothetical protein